MPRTSNSPTPGGSAAKVVPWLGAAIGGLFFTWIAGTRLIGFTETNWLMQGDWRIHYLGWAFFRHEPWHLPPGRIDGYFSPLGTSIGFTDSIPLLALALKPFSALLPASMQYIGAWLAACFALQGVFAVLLMRLWTPSAIQQLLGAACFVLLPALLMRTLHPALCAHWLLLWALWLYQREPRPDHRTLTHVAAVALVAGLVHPYLAVMTLGLVMALGVRQLVRHQRSGLGTIALAIAGVLIGWWLSGLFTVSGAENLGAGGAGMYSMNLLALITPTGWSTLLPELPIGADGQRWEGFQYFGLGLLLLVAIACVVRVSVRQTARPIVWWPLAVIAGACAVYALSPRVTFGSAVLLHIDSPLVDRLEIFRATGRFFWPMAYLLLVMSLSVIVSRLTPRIATAMLAAVVIVQAIDLREAHASRRRAFHEPSFYGWAPRLASPAWPRILPHYEHLVMYPPSYCGTPPVDIESLAWIVAPHRITINGGLVARYDDERRAEACRELDARLVGGEVDDATVYVGRPGEMVLLKKLARQPMVCGTLDTVGICATARSYERWRDVAKFR